MTLLCLLCPNFSSAQRSLDIGKKMPDIVLRNFYRDSRDSISVGTMKGKLIIFDFWNIWCKACIEAMPKMESLQKIFGNKIQIILVTRNSKKEVASLFSKIKIPLPNLPILVSDTKLHKLFLHDAEPFHVWIDPNLRVKYLTEGYYSTEYNIRKLLDGQSPSIPSRLLPGTIDLSHGLLPAVPKVTGNLLGYSIFLKATHKITTNNLNELTESENGSVTSITLINSNKWELLNLAYNREIYGMPVSLFQKNNRFVIEDSLKLSMIPPRDITTYDTWKEKNIFSYEASVGSGGGDALALLKRDINTYLDINAYVEKRLIKCLALTLVGSDEPLRSKNLRKSPTFSMNFQKGLTTLNGKIKNTLLYALITANQDITTPIVDLTNYNTSIDLVVSCDLRDINSLNLQLREYNLALVEKEILIDMVIVKRD